MLEVIATVILRCYDKNAIEELYLVNLLHFDDPDVGLWKGVKTDLVHEITAERVVF